MESPKMLRKCFLCTTEFEGSESMTDLSSSQISLMFQVFQISPDDTGKYLLRLMFQNVCYCSECFEIISNLSSLAEELEILEEKVSTEKRNIVDRLRQSTTNFSEKITGPPGMLQILRTEIISEIDKVCARKRVRSKDFPSTSEMKKQNRPISKSTQTDYVYDHNNGNSCRQISQDRSCDNESDCADSSNWPVGTSDTTNLMTPPKNDTDQILNDNDEDDSGANVGSMSVLNMNIISFKNEKNLAEMDSTPVADPLEDTDETKLDMGIVQDNMETSEQIQNRSYICGPCDDVFDDYSALKAHDSAHHNVRSKIKESPANEEETGKLESNDSSNLRKKTKKDNRLRSKSTEPETISEIGSPREKRYLRGRISTKSVPGNSSACVDSGPLPNGLVVVGTGTEEDEKKLITVQIDVIHDRKTNGKIKKEESARCEPPTKSTTQKRKKNSIVTSGTRKRNTAFYQPKKCEECGQILSNLGTWRNHVLAIHEKEGKHKCELCDYICQFSGHLKDHMASRHTDVGNFKCVLCKKTFKLLRNLKQHQRVHEGDTPYECELCSAKFKYSASLCAHKIGGHCKQIKVESPLVKRVKVPRNGKSVWRKKSPNH